MAQYLDETGLKALWEKIKQRIESGVGTIDLSPYLKIADVATINGKSLTSGGDITIDLTLFKVVSALPTTDIDQTKIYLVKSSETTTGNEYSEYIYTGSAWEELGTYKSDVDLTPYAKTTDVNTALATKVDKVSGKALSTNDFTTAYKNKLDAIAAGANNYSLPTASSTTLGGVKVGTNLSISNGVLSATDTTYGNATTSASGLMSSTDKAKLDGIAANANNYTHPTSAAGALASGLYKITTDASGHVIAATAVAKADITGLGIPAQDTTYSSMTGATSSAAGKTGLVPAPAAGKQASFLRGDGTWVVPDNTTYNDATTSTHGLMTAADKTKLNGVASGATADSAIPVSTINALS